MGERLTPVIVAKNVGTGPAVVTARVPYTRIDGTTGTVNLPSTNLQAGELKTLDVRQIVQRARQEQINIAGLEITYNTAPGSVIVNAHSQSTDGNQVFRVPMWDPFGQKSPTGGYPWRIESTSTTKTYIKNITDREQYYVAYLNWENGEKYMIGMRAIAPHQTIEIDVKKLRDEQTPDENGQIIPLGATKGQLKWSIKQTGSPPAGEETRQSLALIGRTEQIDLENGTSSNYACQNWCESSYVASYLTPGNTEVEVGAQVDYNVYQQDMDHYGDLTEFYQRMLLVNGPTTWISNQTGVATIGSNSIATATGAGTTTITATWQDYNAPVGTICEPERAETEDNSEPKETSENQVTDVSPRPNVPDPPCEACANYSIWPTPSVVLSVKPTVTITAIKAVGKDHTASIRVVTNNPSNVSITLTLAPKSGTTGSAQFTSNNTSTRTITSTTNVEVKGITESSTKRSMRLEAKYTDSNSQVVSLGTMDFTVVKATLSLKLSGTVTSDNQASSHISTQIGTTNLGGPAISTGAAANIMRTKLEIKATVLPSDWDESATLQRDRVENRTYNDQTLTVRQVGCSDTSESGFMDLDPQSGGSGGKIYDYDAPGLGHVAGNPVGTKHRTRVNFKQWLSVFQNDGAGTAEVRLSDDITWFERLSIVKDAGGNTILLNDVSGDNTLGSGTTNLTWDLSSGGGSPSTSPC
jgi:hypothetical protein